MCSISEFFDLKLSGLLVTLMCTMNNMVQLVIHIDHPSPHKWIASDLTLSCSRSVDIDMPCEWPLLEPWWVSSLELFDSVSGTFIFLLEIYDNLSQMVAVFAHLVHLSICIISELLKACSRSMTFMSASERVGILPRQPQATHVITSTFLWQCSS